jgi:hypothetical protein
MVPVTVTLTLRIREQLQKKVMRNFCIKLGLTLRKTYNDGSTAFVFDVLRNLRPERPFQTEVESQVEFENEQ